KSRSLTRELWITNINYKKDIKIDDLGLVIPSGQSKNLLSNNCKDITIEQIEKSLENGSLFKKSNYLKVRQVAPVVPGPTIKASTDYRIVSPTRFPGLRTNITIEEREYEDLDFEDSNSTDEMFASEISAAATASSTPILAVDKQFKDEE